MTRCVFWAPAARCWGIVCGVPSTGQHKFSSLTGDSFGQSRSPFDRCPLLQIALVRCERLITLHPDLGKMYRLGGCLCSIAHGRFSPIKITLLTSEEVSVLISSCSSLQTSLTELRAQGSRHHFNQNKRPQSFLWPDLHPVLWQRSCLYLWHGASIKDLKSVLQTRAQWIVASAEPAKRWIETVLCFSLCPVYPDHGS